MSRGAWISTALMLLSLVVILGLAEAVPAQGHYLTCVVLGMISLFFVKSDFAQSRISRVSTPGTPEHVVRARSFGARQRMCGRRKSCWVSAPLILIIVFPSTGRPPCNPAQCACTTTISTCWWTGVDRPAAGRGVAGHVDIRHHQSWKYSQRTSSDLSAKTSNRAAFVLGSTLGLGALGLHSSWISTCTSSNAMLATTLAALLTAFIRFATERYWVPLKMPQRLALTVVVGGHLFC